MIAYFKAVTMYFLNFCINNCQYAHFHTEFQKTVKLLKKKIEFHEKRLLITF